jgi:hypothetical protein
MTPQEKLIFHPRITNNRKVPFSNSETSFLQKGLKYNLHTKKEIWIQNLALDIETAITQLLTNEWKFYRELVDNHIDELQWQYNSNPTHNTHLEAKLMKSIQTELQ